MQTVILLMFRHFITCVECVIFIVIESKVQIQKPKKLIVFNKWNKMKGLKWSEDNLDNAFNFFFQFMTLILRVSNSTVGYAALSLFSICVFFWCTAPISIKRLTTKPTQRHVFSKKIKCMWTISAHLNFNDDESTLLNQ